jgi:hypothetical protein
VILQITFSIWFLLQNDASTIEYLQEENSRTLGDYSRRLQDYSRISWSTFQPRDASNTLENFWLVVLGDTWELLIKAVKTTRNYPARLQSTRGLLVWTSLGHYSGGYQDRLLDGPLGLPDLCYTEPDGMERKDYGGGVLG